MLRLRKSALLVLRVALVLATWGWGISFAFTFASWDAAAIQLESLGARNLQYQPILDYWLRMASAVFGCIGLAAALACWKPQKFEVVIRLFPPFHAFVGVVLLVAAIRNDLTPGQHPSFLVDISFCFAVAILIQGALLFRETGEQGAEK